LHILFFYLCKNIITCIPLQFYNFNYCINTKPMKYSLRFLVSRCRVLYVTSIIFTKHVDLKLSALSYILTVSSIDEVNWRKPKKCCKTRRPYMGRCSYIDCQYKLSLPKNILLTVALSPIATPSSNWDWNIEYWLIKHQKFNVVINQK
jgi:hypothetical protein